MVLAGCSNNGADLSKVGAATYRGPVVVSSDTAPGTKQQSRSNDVARSKKSSDATPAAPIEPADLEPGAEAVGNGFYVDDKGHILTTWSQIRSCRRVAVLDNFELLHVTLIAGSSLNALAILGTRQPSPVHAVLRASPVVKGEKVSAHAYPILDGMFMPLEIVDGVVQSPTGPAELKGVLQSTAYLGGQSAGGPLVGRHGEVVGIVIDKLSPDWPSDIGYGISVEVIHRLFASIGVDIWAQGTSGQGDSSGQQAPAHYAGDYMVPIICFR
jgi:S1-C subfamily serine protease